MKGARLPINQHQSSAGELDLDVNSDNCEQETMILDLPPEIIALILIRLPVKTLSILKCVNTYFSPLISCPDFVREHFKFSTENASLSSYKVLIEGDGEFLNLKQTSIQSICHESPGTFVNLDYPEKELQKVVWLVRSSCNGLVVVIVNQENWFIWNPAIRKYKKLPAIVGYGNLERYVIRDPRFCCGFGFDASNDDYKVVALFPLESDVSKSKRDYVVYVYSLKRNSWIRIPDFTCEEEFTDISGVFASGNLYWCTENGDIVSFDVEKEVFGILDHPNYFEGFYYPLLRILEGSIAVVCTYNGHADVWIVKEYGNVASWTKMFTLSFYHDFASLDFTYPRPFYILPNGEVLNDDGVFDIYNPKDKSWRSTGICFDAETVIYVESLVSPCYN